MNVYLNFELKLLLFAFNGLFYGILHMLCLCLFVISLNIILGIICRYSDFIECFLDRAS